MTQNYTRPQSDDDLSTSILTTIPDTIETVATEFAGTSFPASPLEGQVFSDTSTGYRWHYRGGSWKQLGLFSVPFQQWNGSDPFSAFLAPQPFKFDVTGVGILSPTGTTGSDASNRWTMQVINWTAVAFLFTPGSEPTTNGDEILANTPWLKVPVAAATIAPNAALQIVLAEVGTAPNAGTSTLFLQAARRFD